MLGDKSLVECPTQCGGPNANHSALDAEALDLRLRMGCDKPCSKVWYSILCPSCNGTRIGQDGKECREDDCQETRDKNRGMKFMYRCPGSFQDANISQALKSWSQLREYKTWPVKGGALDQTAAFLAFLSVAEEAIESAKPED